MKITIIRHEPNKRFSKNIDEISIKSLQKQNHCYNELGKRFVIKTKSQEVYKKYTGIFAIYIKGV